MLLVYWTKFVVAAVLVSYIYKKTSEFSFRVDFIPSCCCCCCCCTKRWKQYFFRQSQILIAHWQTGLYTMCYVLYSLGGKTNSKYLQKSQQKIDHFTCSMSFASSVKWSSFLPKQPCTIIVREINLSLHLKDKTWILNLLSLTLPFFKLKHDPVHVFIVPNYSLFLIMCLLFDLSVE